jgi:hypothetical protein
MTVTAAYTKKLTDPLAPVCQGLSGPIARHNGLRLPR